MHRTRISVAKLHGMSMKQEGPLDSSYILELRPASPGESTLISLRMTLESNEMA